MNTGLISMRYANALFQLSHNQEELLDRLHHDSQVLLDSLVHSKELVSFLRNPVIKMSVKKSFLRSVFQKSFHERTLSFLDVVINNNREILLRNILMDFADIYRKHKGLKSVTLITAVPVDDSFAKQMGQVIGERLNAKIALDCKVNEDLMGGVVVIVDGKQADGSVAGKLRAMKKKLLKK